MSDGMKAYRIIKIMKKIEAHKANLIDDFSQLNDGALNSKNKTRYLNG